MLELYILHITVLWKLKKCKLRYISGFNFYYFSELSGLILCRKDFYNHWLWFIIFAKLFHFGAHCAYGRKHFSCPHPFRTYSVLASVACRIFKTAAAKLRSLPCQSCATIIMDFVLNGCQKFQFWVADRLQAWLLPPLSKTPCECHAKIDYSTI